MVSKKTAFKLITWTLPLLFSGGLRAQTNSNDIQTLYTQMTNLKSTADNLLNQEKTLRKQKKYHEAEKMHNAYIAKLHEFSRAKKYYEMQTKFKNR
ncbi:hypothetical protein FACS18945_2410 [Bacteroidia bacterium]|nr:hypothetical protein FACS18945_2410 [Bacteroidia bacterium]